MNKYDNVQLNIKQLCDEAFSRPTRYDPTSRSGQKLGALKSTESILARYSTAALYTSGLLARLTHSNLKLDWFKEFQEYWMKGLGLRRIEPHDFHFLSGIYRQKFQSLEVDEAQGNEKFLEAWQRPETLYLLFAYQYKLALHPLSAYTIAKYIPKRARICEYGCGLGPITQSLATYYPTRNLNITAADIPSYMLHFLQWKYKNTPYIQVLPIDPADSSPLTQTYNVITCMTVFEHLPNPLQTAQHLHKQLKPGGIFMFDYIKSEGTGLDTKKALEERERVLQFIRDHFTILKGEISTDDSNVKTVICQKRG